MSDQLERLRELEQENALLKQRVDQLNKKVDSAFSGIAKAMWIIAGTFLATSTSWFFGGGFK